MTTLTLDTPALPALSVGWQQVQDWRDDHFRRRPARKVRSEAEGLAFLNDVGCAFLFPQAGVVLPSLWEAINGRERAIPHHHHDHALSLTWTWKDSLPAARAIWYGKLIRGKPTFVSLDLLPAFYALSSNFGELDDYKEQYAD